MEMPKPGAEHAKLMRFVGRWRGEEMLSASPFGPGGPASAQSDLREAVDGMALLHDYVETRADGGTFRAHGVFMIDPANGDVLWWGFDSMGFPPDAPARGRWDGDRLRLEKQTPRGEARHEFTLGADRYELVIRTRLAGQQEFTTFLEGRYRREA